MWFISGAASRGKLESYRAYSSPVAYGSIPGLLNVDGKLLISVQQLQSFTSDTRCIYMYVPKSVCVCVCVCIYICVCV